MQENQGSWKQVRRAVLVALTGAALALGEGAMAQATPKPPERMTYQGFIAGSDGVALGNTAPKNYDVIFRIYDSEGSNTPLWGEQQTVTVDKGYFSVLLGEGAPVGGSPNAGVSLSSLFSSATASDRFVGFTVKGIGTGGADVDILPRVRLMSSHYAFLASRALTSDTSSRLVQSSGADLLAVSGTELSMSGNLLINPGKYLMLGAGTPGKEGSAGMISYRFHTPDSLEIVGAGNTASTRKITFINDGGATFYGPVSAPSLSLSGNLGVGGALSVGSSMTAGNEVTAPVLSGNAYYQTGSGGMVFGHGRPKQYPLNGSIYYATTAVDNKETLLIQGGGEVTANRTVDVYADGGFRTFGVNYVRAPYYIELGWGLEKEVSAGQIAYQRHTTDCLDIIGAGTSGSNRRVQLHATWTFAENANFRGTVYANAFQNNSDRRIKDVVGVSQGADDLQTLRGIRVTDYRLKSQPAENQRVVKGVIAQELQTLMPHAIQVREDAIPWDGDALIKVSWQEERKPVSIETAAAHGFKMGDRLRVEVDGMTKVATVATVTGERTFTATVPAITAAPKSARIVGREVKDFLSVDYQQVYMTAVSALQEVDRRLQVVEKREARMAELEAKATRVETLERDLADLRKLVVSIQDASGKAKQSAAAGGTGEAVGRPADVQVLLAK